IDPKAGPRVPRGDDSYGMVEKLVMTVRALVPPILMIVAVLGSMMFGWAAPTEAAGLGAFGAILLTAFYGRLTLRVFREALVKTLIVTCMVVLILLGGSIFTGVFVGAGGIGVIRDLVQLAELGPWGLLFLFLTVVFIAGFFLEWISIILIFIPIF